MNKTQEKKQQQVMTTAYNDFEKGMNKYSFFKIHAHPLSNDLVQDTFIKAWAYIVKGGNIILMKSFLYHILNDLIIDEYRKKKSVSLDALLENGYEPRDDKDSERNMNILDGKTAMLLIEELAPKYKKVMKMKYVQNLSLSEISILCNQAKNTTAVQIHRGIEMLKILYNHNKKPII